MSFNISELDFCLRAGSFYHFGFSKTTDKSDFDIKLFSLKEKLESLCLGFHGWFKRKRRDDFVTSFVQSSRGNRRYRKLLLTYLLLQTYLLPKAFTFKAT